MSDYRTDRPYWCESCARQKDCYGITLRPKCFVPIADRKTEPNSSEIPTGSTISKMEQVDKDINVRSKDELQSDDVFDYCPRCGMRILSKWAKDEPQTDIYEYNNGEWVKPDCPWE